MINLGKNQKGQGMAEYVLLILLVALLVFGAVKIFGGKIKSGFEKASNKIEEAQSDD